MCLKKKRKTLTCKEGHKEYKKIHIEFLPRKRMSAMENKLSRINRRSNTTEENISELENMLIETIQHEIQEKKTKMNSGSGKLSVA